MIRSRWSRLQDRLNEPVDAATLGAFRIVFGAMVAYEVIDLARVAQAVYVEPPFHFTYEGFAWVGESPASCVYAALGLTLLAAIAVTLGMAYRMASLALAVGFTYLFLLERAIYLNHFYLIVLVAWLMAVLPADRWATVDLRGEVKGRPSTVPFWNVLILRLQFALVYFFGGVAKLNADWLHGQPLTEWLARREAFPFFGPYLADPWVAQWVFSYGGVAFDLLIGPLLLCRRTRDLALAPLVFFHLTNALVFQIGVFPWLMLGATIIFFDPDTPRRWFSRANDSPAALPAAEAEASSVGGWGPRAATLFFVAWVAIQCVIPLRHWIYPGDVNWNEEGHRFAWRMKLRDKQGWITFAVTDRATGQTQPLTPVPGYAPAGLQLNSAQYRRLLTSPQLAAQYARHLVRNADLLGMEDPEVRAVCLVSLNGRPHQILIDPEADLARVETPWLHAADWIEPLPNGLPIGRYEPLDLMRFDAVLSARFPGQAFWREPTTRP